MTVRRSVLAASCGVILLCSVAVPAAASAQGSFSVWVGSGPAFYDPWYPYYWYRPYYRPVYPVYPYYPYYGDPFSSVRIQARPRDAEVFLDGYFVGLVDDFDGVFQRLRAEPGEHEIELYLPGYRSVVQRVYLQPGRTAHLRIEMEPLAPGDAQPARPVGTPRPAPADRSDPAAPRRPAPPGARPPSSPVEPADRSGTYGSLSVRVQPGDARIFIDGEPWEGPADAGERLVVQLAAGRHLVEVRREGYRSYITEVTVRAGEEATLNVALTPQ